MGLIRKRVYVKMCADGIIASSMQLNSGACAACRAGLTEQQVDESIADRDGARKAKDFAAGDTIREHLAAKGILLMDGPQGTDWRPGPRLDVAEASRS